MKSADNLFDKYRPTASKCAKVGVLKQPNEEACVFRGIRPVIPTTSGHLNRGIRPALFSGFEA